MNKNKEEITSVAIGKPVKKSSKIKWKIGIDEAVSYGFSVVSGVTKYLIFIIILIIFSGLLLSLSFEASLEGNDELGLFYTALYFILSVVIFLLTLSLIIGLSYKFGGDILLKAVETHNRFAYKLRQGERK